MKICDEGDGLRAQKYGTNQNSVTIYLPVNIVSKALSTFVASKAEVSMYDKSFFSENKNDNFVYCDDSLKN